MSLEKKFINKILTADGKNPATALSMQDALIILGVYIAHLDPNHCQEKVRRIVDLAKNQPEFRKISEDSESTEKRVYHYFNMMQTPEQTEALIVQAMEIVSSSDVSRSAVGWMRRICDTMGSTGLGVKRLNEIVEKLT